MIILRQILLQVIFALDAGLDRKRRIVSFMADTAILQIVINLIHRIRLRITHITDMHTDIDQVMHHIIHPIHIYIKMMTASMKRLICTIVKLMINMTGKPQIVKGKHLLST